MLCSFKSTDTSLNYNYKGPSPLPVPYFTDLHHANSETSPSFSITMRPSFAAVFLVATAMAQPVDFLEQRDVQASGSQEIHARDQLLNLQVGGKTKPGKKPALIDIKALTELIGIRRA